MAVSATPRIPTGSLGPRPANPYPRLGVLPVDRFPDREVRGSVSFNVRPHPRGIAHDVGPDPVPSTQGEVGAWSLTIDGNYHHAALAPPPTGLEPALERAS